MGHVVHLLGNPRARAGRAGADIGSVSDALRAAGADVVAVTATERAGVRPVLAEAVAGGAARVVVAGGDGLVHLAVQELAGTGVAVGIVPVGTGNDLARALGLPRTVPEAVAVALGDPRPFDLLRTEHGWVASVATLGFSAVVNARANRLAWPRGSRRYTVATLAEIGRFRPRRLVLGIDGEEHRVDAGLVALGNTPFFGGGMRVCPGADPEDGLIDVTVIGAVGRLELLRMLPTVYTARHVRHRAVTRHRGRVVTVAEPEGGGDGGGAAAGLWGDGEPVGPLPVRVEAVPGALHLAVPGSRLPTTELDGG